MPQSFSHSPLAANQLITLRALGLLLQLLLSVFGADAFGLSLTTEPLQYVFAIELAYLGVTLWLRHGIVRHSGGLFISLLIDTLLWISWLYFSGGATNAFISLLLLPIAIAAVTLPSWAPWTMAALTTAAYSLMLFAAPDSSDMAGSMHSTHAHMGHEMADTGGMNSHFIGMWLNFVLSALVLTTSVALISRRLRAADARLAALRESQLRQEQLLALGTASAQMSHQLATPLATLRLLIDEAMEEAAADVRNGAGNGAAAGAAELPAEMDLALRRCESTLSELRAATEAIRERHQAVVSVEALCTSLADRVLLLMPDVSIEIELDKTVQPRRLCSDMSLLPSLLALVDNGARASRQQTGEARVWLSATAVDNNRLRLTIRDEGKGIDAAQLQALGARPVASEQGLGMALMLTHASLERLGGELVLSNIAPVASGDISSRGTATGAASGCIASVYLPLLCAEEAGL
ncbi:HAMP domain-containing histidine kinase [Shewanella sp. JM162201]|uniref:histidine kinase n=1 Tax=Shewanella jiangmenensis TaxID=2837387 RepID=A0ABS5V0Y4_9GAMM|nr:HAMP domain-containing sensor histidine kinase [Shewanella jiangmenensis]MBT1444129.1 HAMP domain-containing histidine kinase [Shewanella jiangmenensis]